MAKGTFWVVMMALSVAGISCSSSRTTMTSGSRGGNVYNGSGGGGLRLAHRNKTVRTTAYSDMEMEAGGRYRNLSASGAPLKYGRVRSAAADWSKYPVGTLFRIDGQPYLYEVDDYGSSLVGTETIDIYKPTLDSMRQWGTRNVGIKVLRWGSYAKSLDILKDRMYAPHVREMVSSISRRRT